MRAHRQEVVLNDEQLQERLAYWQEKLRLQDYLIDASIVRYHEMSGDDVIGNCYCTPSVKRATIKLLDPNDHEGYDPYDMEWTLVHELLHIHTRSLIDSDDEVLEEEQVIESITYGLIQLERKGQMDGTDL